MRDLSELGVCIRTLVISLGELGGLGGLGGCQIKYFEITEDTLFATAWRKDFRTRKCLAST